MLLYLVFLIRRCDISAARHALRLHRCFVIDVLPAYQQGSKLVPSVFWRSPCAQASAQSRITQWPRFGLVGEIDRLALRGQELSRGRNRKVQGQQGQSLLIYWDRLGQARILSGWLCRRRKKSQPQLVQFGFHSPINLHRCFHRCQLALFYSNATVVIDFLRKVLLFCQRDTDLKSVDDLIAIFEFTAFPKPVSAAHLPK